LLVAGCRLLVDRDLRGNRQLATGNR